MLLPPTQSVRPSNCSYFVVFTLLACLLIVNGVSSLRPSKMVVRRKEDGDDFTNVDMLSLNVQRQCASLGATCVEDLTKSCRECKCNPGNETYQSDVKRCVSTEQLDLYSGCGYKGIKDHQKEILDLKLTTLDLTKTADKVIQVNFRMPLLAKIECHIANTTGFLNHNGQWQYLSNITDVLQLSIYDLNKRYLKLIWESVNKYAGLIIKLNIVCKSNDRGFINQNCFLFKTAGKHIDIIRTIEPTTEQPETTKSTFETTPSEDVLIDVRTVTGPHTTTSTIEKKYTYTIAKSVIIGVICGVVFVIVIIIIIAIFCVRSRVRKLREPKAMVANVDLPKVHFTAQARFSLIQETGNDQELLEQVDGDYTALKSDRESYAPYCSLRKDDVDLNVIDQVLKDAVSTDSKSSSAPRYSYRLSGDQTVIATVPITRSHNYHVLEGPEDPDYEEVSSSDEESCASNAANKLLDSKPPLPDREYHVLEAPVESHLHSNC